MKGTAMRRRLRGQHGPILSSALSNPYVTRSILANTCGIRLDTHSTAMLSSFMVVRLGMVESRAGHLEMRRICKRFKCVCRNSAPVSSILVSVNPVACFFTSGSVKEVLAALQCSRSSFNTSVMLSSPQPSLKAMSYSSLCPMKNRSTSALDICAVRSSSLC